ncbi:hypothetical protein V0288_04245 [Pannus brasiliensis CCIBt3594]|uniref:Uncharacterized protein n=1 Tax=Pannus brasiliensis CCIBt3594 TaxID=1427578 RepID=A0AAW9QRS3_9CHRO
MNELHENRDFPSGENAGDKNSRRRSAYRRSAKPRVIIFPIVFGTFFGWSGRSFDPGAIARFPSPSHATELKSPLSAPDRNVPPETLLEVNDLPPGFEVAPPLLRQMVTRAIDRSGADLKKANISVRETTIFVNIEEAEMVTCLTMDLPDRTARESFDARLQRDGGREVFQSGFQQALRLLGEAKIEESRAIVSLQGLGESARGYRLAATIENFPVRVFADSLAFRRGSTGVVLIVGSLAREPEKVQVRDLALSLDRRLQNESARRRP